MVGTSCGIDLGTREHVSSLCRKAEDSVSGATACCLFSRMSFLFLRAETERILNIVNKRNLNTSIKLLIYLALIMSHSIDSQETWQPDLHASLSSSKYLVTMCFETYGLKGILVCHLLVVFEPNPHELALALCDK